LSARSNDVVFAASRDPSTATDLAQLAKERKNLHLIKITSGDVEDNRAAAKLVAEQIGRVDVVIANAGACELCGFSSSTRH
jgi:NAD(P)-dependent dehydrogenase (short-subunit alcohol dehydrogenase family)